MRISDLKAAFDFVQIKMNSITMNEDMEKWSKIALSIQRKLENAVVELSEESESKLFEDAWVDPKEWEDNSELAEFLVQDDAKIEKPGFDDGLIVKYVEYIAENLDMSIKYSEYLAEQILELQKKINSKDKPEEIFSEYINHEIHQTTERGEVRGSREGTGEPSHPEGEADEVRK